MKYRRLVSKAPHEIYLVTGTDARGDEAYFFVRVASDQYQKFKRELEDLCINLSHYDILHSDYGTESSKEVWEMMGRKYGCKLESAA